MSELADRFGVTPAQLRNWNGISGNRLLAGKTLKIYGNNENTSLGDKTVKTSANLNHYKVRPGDTIGQIAELYRVSASEIRKWNKLTSNKILTGRTLKIYSDAGINDIPEVNTKTTKKSSTHNVRRGETLFSIARKYGVTVASIQTMNNLDGTKITVGQKLKID
jgi:membrane-bound lytic murein transglycosylase D